MIHNTTEISSYQQYLDEKFMQKFFKKMNDNLAWQIWTDLYKAGKIKTKFGELIIPSGKGYWKAGKTTQEQMEIDSYNDIIKQQRRDKKEEEKNKRRK